MKRIDGFSLPKSETFKLQTLVGPQNKYTSRSLGFSLIISNATVPNKGEICFHDKDFTTSTIPSLLDITCSIVGRYVFFTNKRLERIGYPEGYSAHAYVDVCEMEVYGIFLNMHQFSFYCH